MTSQQLLQPGFAIRRMSCPSGIEVDCGNTGFDGFHACCPSGYTCPGPQYNTVCCLPGATGCNNDALAAVEKPTCANATWDMFDNGGYFCCEHGLPGYNKSNTNGCGSPNASISGTIQFLSTVTVGVDPKTMIASSSVSASTTAPAIVSASAAPSTSTPSSATTSSAASATPASQSSSPTPVGAIAGGVVGGVAVLIATIFLAWFFWHRRRRDKTAELHGDPQMLHGGSKEYYRQDAGEPVVHEMGEHGSKTPAAELAAVQMPDAELAANQRPAELDGTGRSR